MNINREIKFSARQWLIYFAAWVPYGLSYIAVFLAQGIESIWLAFTTMLCNVPAAALLGIGLIHFFNRFNWSRRPRWYFFPVHLFSALAFSFIWYGLVLLCLTLYESFRDGVWTPHWFTGYALQWQTFSGVMIYATIASVIYLLQISNNLRIEEQRANLAETRAAQAEALYAQSQLSALRAQLNPHFLFNTLHSLMALTRYEPDKAEMALEKLAEMLRYVLQEKRELSTGLVRLEEEWKFVENYLELEKMRLGERLVIKSEIDSRSFDCLIPAFTLQPLVENAIKHGISPHQRTGTIFIKTQKNKDQLELEVTDDGVGNNNGNNNQSNGLGLKLVREQLENTYSGEAKFSVENGNGFSVKIKIPLRKKDFADPDINN